MVGLPLVLKHSSSYYAALGPLVDRVTLFLLSSLHLFSDFITFQYKKEKENGCPLSLLHSRFWEALIVSGQGILLTHFFVELPDNEINVRKQVLSPVATTIC